MTKSEVSRCHGDVREHRGELTRARTQEEDYGTFEAEQIILIVVQGRGESIEPRHM